MASEDLARRFLHVNLNCGSLDATEHALRGTYWVCPRGCVPTRASPTDGTILGLDGETYCATAFLYDSRGGRGGCALEAIEYHTPALQA